MGKIKLAVLVLIAVFLLCACGGKEAAELVYRDTAFECELSWEAGGEQIRARLVASAPSELGQRNISLSFIEPSAMRGICVTREGEGVWVELDGMRIDGGDMSGWLEIERLFEAHGELSYLSSETVGGEVADVMRLSRENGDTVDISISRHTGLPIRIVGHGLDAKILYFENGD